MDTIMASLPEDRTGRGSGLVQSLRQTGGALGIAGLGSIVSSVYRDRFDPAGLPAAAAETARDSIGGAAAVAERLGTSATLVSARDAYVHGMDAALTVCAIGALIAAALMAAFLPGRTRQAAQGAASSPDDRQSEHEHVAS
jgi:hypothetical protein